MAYMHNPTLLDLGCGLGWLSEKVPYYKYIGVDSVKQFCDFAEKKFSNSRRSFLKQDITNLSAIEDDTIDCAISCFTHCWVKDINAVAQEAYRVLTYGGSLFILTPNPSTYHEMGKRYGFLDRYFADNYQKAYTISDGVATGTIHGKAMYLSDICMYLHTRSELLNSVTSAGFSIYLEEPSFASELPLSGTAEGLFLGIVAIKDN